MTDNICACHCGTRISLDEQLLEERQMWKQKYLCLQKQATNDIGRLKENIYAQCSSLMQKQFNTRELEQSKIVNEKNGEIRNLTSRIINMEARIKIIQKQNQILKLANKQLQSQQTQKDDLIKTLKSRGNKSERDWQVKLEQQMANLRKRISQQYQEEMQKLEAENQHLKHKVKEFEKKYQIIIPEVQKLKNNLNSKNEQIQGLESKLEKVRKESEQTILRLNSEKDEIQKLHGKCKGNHNKLNQKIEQLSQELQNSKKIKRQVKIEPVYIERPVQVQKIVEKIIEVEKIVNKYIEPTTFRDEELESQNKKMKQEINNILREFHILEDKFRAQALEYEECIRQHQENVVKYKRQRESLVKTIDQQNKEIDQIHNYLQRKKLESRNVEPEKIIVHVNKDGHYQKTIERTGSATNFNTQIKPLKKK